MSTTAAVNDRPTRRLRAPAPLKTAADRAVAVQPDAVARAAEVSPQQVLEKAEWCKHMVATHHSEAEIADKLQVSKQYVHDLLTLHDAPEELRAMVAQGRIAPATLVRALNKHGERAAPVIEQALIRAKAQGKSKVTKSMLADPNEKWAKKAALPLFQLLTEVRKDPGYDSIDQSLRDQIQALVAQIERGPKRKPPRKAGA